MLSLLQEELKEMVTMAARAIRRGSISFGLVSILIEVLSATQREDYTSLNQLCEKGHIIKYKKWCPVEEREVLWSEIQKGYEITKNNYVVLEKEEIENIKLKTTNTIEIKEFINSEEFDPLFIEKNYYNNTTNKREDMRDIKDETIQIKPKILIRIVKP